MEPDQTAAVLAEALRGHRVTKGQRRALAQALRGITEALPPGSGPMGVLSTDLADAADLLAPPA